MHEFAKDYGFESFFQVYDNVILNDINKFTFMQKNALLIANEWGLLIIQQVFMLDC